MQRLRPYEARLAMLHSLIWKLFNAPASLRKPGTPLASAKALSAAALSVALAACGGGGGGGSSETAASGETSSAPSTTAAAAAAPPANVEASTVLVAAQAAAAAETQQQAAQAALKSEASATAVTEQAATAAPPTPVAAPEPVTIAARPAPAPTPAPPQALVVRARGSLAGGTGPVVQVRAAGQVLGTVTVQNTQWANYSFALPSLPTGTVVDVVFTNDGVVGTEDRNLFVATVSYGAQTVMPTASNATLDRGTGAAAFDGVDVLPGTGNIYWGAALRLTWPAPTAVTDTRLYDAARLLAQASFGPTLGDLQALQSQTPAAWINAQMTLPISTSHVATVQAQYNQGDAWRPNGANYTAAWVAQSFWKAAATAPDPLRQRTAFALSQIFTVSQADSNLWMHSRAVAAYHDLLARNAFGNFRTLIEDVALSPAMGVYLSHMRNRKEDAATGRVPDENFARELMQLFTIGLHELNPDGSTKRDANGNPIETYNNNDVMALAKVFTGWSWAFPDAELTEAKFRWGSPDYSAAKDQRIDILPMKAYPGMHSTAAKTLFSGKPWAINLPVGGSAQADLKLALDGLFNHPNVGPFISRQLIQRLVASNPTPAYVARVASVFNNNGSGVRGDLAAVVRAVLLDTEARTPGSATASAKLREPVLRVAHWARALGAQSATGQWTLAWELESSGQRALAPPSVFGHFRPGYVPPNTAFAQAGATAPEFQIVNEGTVAAWINTAEAMAGGGLGWNGNSADVRVDYAALGGLAAAGDIGALVDRLNLLLMAGRMSATLRQASIDAAASASANTPEALASNRARAATFLVLATPAFASQP